MTTEARQQLYDALKAHNFELGIIRGAVSDPDLAILDRRIDASRLLLEWISQALELEPPASPEAQTPPPSSSPVDQHQTAPSALDPPKPSRR